MKQKSGRPNSVKKLDLSNPIIITCKNLSRVLFSLREQCNLTQIELAKILGVTHATIHNYEGNKSLPPTYFLLDILKFYGYHLELVKDGKEKEE